MHRDTLGSAQIIEAGAVNLMTAGRGIAHSERTPPEDRQHEHAFFGIQSWLALPLDKEEMAPSFSHYDQSAIPTVTEDGMIFHIAAGNWRGLASPVITHNDALFVECHLASNAVLHVPAEIEERAIHVLSGQVSVDHVTYDASRMLVLKPGTEIKLTALTDAHVILLGGSPLEQPRYLWWNFVASSKERIEQAKLDWQEGKFGHILVMIKNLFRYQPRYKKCKLGSLAPCPAKGAATQLNLNRFYINTS